MEWTKDVKPELSYIGGLPKPGSHLNKVRNINLYHEIQNIPNTRV